MNIKSVSAAFFSATGTTQKIILSIAEAISVSMKIPCTRNNFTYPSQREENLIFSPEDLVVFGTPVYAGRVPNILLEYLKRIEGHGAIAVPVVVYGNRDYDDALIELRDLLESSGMKTVAAGAFVGEHSFSKTLAEGRPDCIDLDLCGGFGRRIAKLAAEDKEPEHPIKVEGTPFPYRGYYTPRDRAGNPVDIRRVKPLTSTDCTQCGHCAEICPMGSISFEDASLLTGICIKCGACIKGCPENAKYYDDANYLYHKKELEEGYVRRGRIWCSL